MDSDLFMQNEPNSGVVGDGTSKGWSCRKLARRQARPTQDQAAQTGAEWDGQTWKLENACPIGAASGEWQMEDDGGRGRAARAEVSMADDQSEVESDGCDAGKSSEPMPEQSLGRVAGHNSHRVIENSTNNKIGILSHGGTGTHAAGQPGQGDGVGQCLPDDVMRPKKAPNKANLGSKQGLESQEFKSETAGAEGRKQSQSSQGDDRKAEVARWLTGSAEWPVASEAEGSELLRAARVPPLRRSHDLDSPGDGQMKSRTYRVTLAGLTKSTAFRTT